MKSKLHSLLFFIVTIYGFSEPIMGISPSIVTSFNTPTITNAIVVPSLGNYANITIATAGGNSTVTPDAAPTDATRITAYTDTNFKGKFTVNPITGVV